MNIIKKTLSYNELKTIIDSCLETQEPLLRRMIKDMYLVRFTTDIEVPDDVDTAMWDNYNADGTIPEIYKKVSNVGLIDNMINESESFESTMIRIEESLASFLENANALFDKTAKALPKNSKGWDKFMNNFKEVMDYGNKSPENSNDTTTEGSKSNN